MSQVQPSEVEAATGAAPAANAPAASAPAGGPLDENGAPKRSFLWRVTQFFARILYCLFFDLKTFGRENIPKRGGVLLVANHQGLLDPVGISVHLLRPVGFMAKAELFQNKVARWLITSLHGFPVRQGEGDVGAVKETIRRLKEGQIVNVYPEGSRTPDGEIQPMLAGVGLIVRRAGVAVVPAAIEGSYDAWSIHRKAPRSRPMRILYGAPLRLEKLKPDQIVKEIDRAIRQLQVRLREMVARERSLTQAPKPAQRAK